MLYELGRLPYENEKIDITYKGYNFETIGIKDKMIDKVRITKVENENQVWYYKSVGLIKLQKRNRYPKMDIQKIESQS